MIFAWTKNLQLSSTNVYDNIFFLPHKKVWGMRVINMHSNVGFSALKSCSCNHMTQVCITTRLWPWVGRVSTHALCLICSAEPTWDYAVLAESPLYGPRNISNIWWMAPMKPYGLQISYNVIPLLVWFPSMTLCKEQSAAFSKTRCQGSNIPRAEKKKLHPLQQHDPKIDPVHGYLEKNLFV